MHWISDNLYLQIREQGTRSWLFRYWVDGKPKVIGLGATRDVTLAEARDRADRLRIEIRDGGAMPYREVPAVVAEIRELGSTSAKALLFTILTAARTGETPGATWNEIDLDEKLWTIPARA